MDLAGETTKFGAPADDGAAPSCDAALRARAVRLDRADADPAVERGPEQTRPWFVRLRELRDDCSPAGCPRDALRQLSMGMSHDFEAAIEEGATIVTGRHGDFRRKTDDNGAPGYRHGRMKTE